ncbi:MAG: cbb3-type cytochrome oxidase assembly protein CcoS [Hyphomicrobium sp.]|nr:cbb3-type cytochrome oxidase assembly protein CcoS [Hyphomicrobium sp.]
MTSLAWLLPAALSLGLLGLGAFLWALRDGQFEDLEGAGWRAIEDGEPLNAAAAQSAGGEAAGGNTQEQAHGKF